eukprot:CAMPEP_0202459324 /NCGR_PEP_ID=MMETSP1360-20130828/34745_1 /ASSEMBLY_ACC=CAM_ASM_000848 /TAXON_ID=515479 /ORGANISM="Licmophora paradoxa, Strain CCMP2313" /LENGTH=241 /DNA_ID=CAMNT_0049080339 /DNA_START=357 /DNA_END=1082 /DNA_ORIENTATION=+
MGNAFSFVKQAIFSLERDMEWNDMLVVLEDTIVAYIRERIDFAARVIAEKAGEKIVDGDVVLTYGRSEAIAHLFKEAARTKDFRVIVVDSKPLLEGKNFVEQLRNAGLDCTYILMNALSYVMPEVTKVFLGTASLQSDGSMLSRVGTACVALAAHSKHIPVLVCGETYKITNRTQLESITNNEMGNPQDVMEGAENLRVINLLYDLTPATFISGIITEMGILPPSSVAVLLREMNPTNAQY